VTTPLDDDPAASSYARAVFSPPRRSLRRSGNFERKMAQKVHKIATSRGKIATSRGRETAPSRPLHNSTRSRRPHPPCG